MPELLHPEPVTPDTVITGAANNYRETIDAYLAAYGAELDASLAYATARDQKMAAYAEMRDARAKLLELAEGGQPLPPLT